MKFSNRLNIEFEPNELSLLFNAKKKRGEKILDLTSSNPTKLNFKYDSKHILKHFIDENSLESYKNDDVIVKRYRMKNN